VIGGQTSRLAFGHAPQQVAEIAGLLRKAGFDELAGEIDKRLDRGRFATLSPTRPSDRSVSLAARELAVLLEGVRSR
jgi:hypothetical protein